MTEPTQGTIAQCRLSLVKEEPKKTPRKCDQPSRAAQYLHEIVKDAWQERMGALLLDTRYRAVGYHLAYSGGLAKATVEPRGLLVPALLTNAAGIIAFHNHPSGDTCPSAEDYAFTRRLAEASDLVGVQLYDHIILGDPPTYYSFREHGGW